MAFPTVAGYTVVGELGRGAGSTIYKVREDVSGKLLAVKCVFRKSRDDLRYVRQVENEYAIGSHLNHPHLVQIYALQRRKRLFRYRQWNLIMEWVEGVSLASNTDYLPEKLIDFFTQSARGLEYMHQRGVIHGDIKPSNILVPASHLVKIVDFGLAGPAGVPRARVQGTLDFIAPEQVQKLPLTEQTDIYNLGASFYTVFSGRRIPAPTVDDEGSMGMPIRDRLIPMDRLRPDLPPELSDIVSACCQWQPEERIQSMAKLVERLESVLNETQDKAALPAPEQRENSSNGGSAGN